MQGIVLHNCYPIGVLHKTHKISFFLVTIRLPPQKKQNQFCQVGGLAIIHKPNEPNLASGQTVKEIVFLILPSSADW